MEFDDDFGVGNSAVRMLYSLLVGKFLYVIITALSLVLLARLLDPSGYGIYTIALGFSALLGAAAPFGISTYMSKYLAEAGVKKESLKISKIITDGYLIIVVVAGVFAVMGLFMSGYASTHIFTTSQVPAIDLVVASLSVFFSVVFGISYSALVGLNRGRNASVATVVGALLQLVLGVGLVVIGYGVYGALVGMLAGDMAGFALATYMVYADVRKRFDYKWTGADLKHITDILRFSLPVATNNLLSSSGVNNFAVLLLGVFATSVVLGNYGIAFRGFNLMLLFYGTVTTVLLPTISKALNRTNDSKKAYEIYNKTMLYSIIVSLPVMIFVGVFSGEIIAIFISNSYSSAPLYLTLIAGGVIVDFIGLYAASFFIAGGKVYTIFKYSIVSTLIEVMALVILVPKFGALGVIIAVFYIGNIVDDVLFVRGVRRHFGIKPDYKQYLKLLVSGIVIAGLFEAVNVANVFVGESYMHFVLDIAVSALVLLLVYPALLVMLRLIDRYIIEDIRRSTRSIPLVEPIANFVLNYMVRLDKMIGE